MKPLLLAFALILSFIAKAQNPSPLTIDLELLASGFDRPVGIYHAGDERIFILEQHDGHIEIVNSNGTSGGTFLDIGSLITTGSEQGLLGLAFHPDYASNGRFFINYTNTSSRTVIAEYAVSAGDANVADASSANILMTINQDFGNHNGGHVEFGPDGYLYIGMGDGGSAGDPNNRAQTNNTMLGKMLRIDVDGAAPYAIPSGNYQDTNPNYSPVPEAWAIGLRNPWKFSFDTSTGQLWIADVGQNAFEEIHVTEPNVDGQNYGWRCYEGNSSYEPSGCIGAGNYVFPVRDYSHSSPYFFCSITGGAVYRGSQYPRMNGHYFFTDYCAGDIYSLEPIESDYNETLVNTDLGFGNAAMGKDNDGNIYVSTLGGAIYKLVDANADFNPVIMPFGSSLQSTVGSTYYWYQDGVLIPGENAQTFTPVTSGTYYAVVENAEGFAAETNSLQWMVTSGVAGCTYEDSDNYNPDAVVDDGSCVFSAGSTCEGDLNGDFIVNANDLLSFLSAYGTSCQQ